MLKLSLEDAHVVRQYAGDSAERQDVAWAAKRDEISWRTVHPI